jgi:hypothetical protein
MGGMVARAFVGLVVLVVLPAGVIAQAPARDNVVQTGTAAIRGRVLEAANGQPVRNVRVHAASTALRDGRTAYTTPKDGSS